MNDSVALDELWWVSRRNLQPVQGALERAFLELWSKNIEQALADNADRGKAPASWREFTLLLATDSVAGKNKGNESTPLEGLSSPIGQLLIAQVLHRELDELAPSVSQWLAASIGFLVDRPTDDSSIAAFVDFRLSHEAGSQLNDEILRPMAPKHPSFATTLEMVAAIRDLSRDLDQVLAG